MGLLALRGGVAEARTEAMYNLLVSADKEAWDRETFVLPWTRFLEYTATDVAEPFKSLDSEASRILTTLPTLFAYETPVNRDARVGWITGIHQRTGEIRLMFQFDPELLPVTAATLQALEWELEISATEMSRTHWSVKKPDLIATLAAQQVRNLVPRPYPLPHPDLSGTEESRPREATGTNSSVLADFLPTGLKDRFEIIQHIGTGSFGAVYQVVDLESQQRLALKVILPTPEALQRAQREVAAARLRHPNILRPLEHHGDGRWLLLPLAEGTLGQFQFWQRLGADAAAEVASSIGRALEHAHGEGLLHRDLHPDNILRYDGRWVVADWGLAVGRTQQRLTRTRSTGGVETWTAPEQLRSLKDADERSDLFSLGRLVEWLANGTLPRPDQPGVLAQGHPLAEFVAATTRLDRSERPASVTTALALLPDRPQVASALVNGGGTLASGQSRRPMPPTGAPLECSVQLSIDFRKKGGDGDRHDYELLVTLKNISRRRLDDWELEFEFPSPLLDGTIHAMRVDDRSDARRTLFRIEGPKMGKKLRPADEQTVRIGYFVNNEIHWTRRDLFDERVSARALVDGDTVAEVSRPMKELQNF